MKNFLVKRMLAFYLTLMLIVGFASPLAPPMEAAQAPPGAWQTANVRCCARPLGKQRALEAYGALPLYFVANQRPQDESIAYYVQGRQHSIYFTAEEMVMAQGETTLRMRFVGAEATPPLGAAKTEARVNYFVGNDPARWRTDIPTYGEVVYHDLYPGIELRYAGQSGALKYTFVVQPGADVSQIRLAYGGAAGLRLDEAGNLLILAGGSELKDTRPYAYQEIGGRRVEVKAEFALHGVRTCGFVVQAYDPRYPLVIDPSLDYSTFLGGGSGDYGYDIVVDEAGNTYVTGASSGNGAFVTKLNPAGSVLIYSTYLGGNSGAEAGWGIAVDGAGNAYVTGVTESNDFPTYNAYDSSLSGDKDAFVTKINAAGNYLFYSTYLGGGDKDEGFDIAVDGLGHAYVTGYTKSTGFPTKEAFQDSCGGCPHNDAFVTKFNTTGDDLVYSTYLGGIQGAGGYGIAVDGAGHAYVTGRASSPFPLLNPYQGQYGGGEVDAFLIKLHTAGSAAFYSTYLGGKNSDFGNDVAVDEAGNAYVTGGTYSPNFPLVNPYQGACNGCSDYLDVFVTKFNPFGSAMLYSTYLGGTGDDGGVGIAVDGDGNIYVTGHTESPNFPLVNTLQVAYGGGATDAFVTKFNAAGNALLYSTYLGGSNEDVGHDIAVNEDGDAHVTGGTRSTNFPIMHPYQGIYGGGDYDAFVAKIGESQIDLSTSSKQVGPTTIVPTGTVTHTLLYTITLANTGDLMADTIYLTDTLPSNLSLTTNPTCPAGGMCVYNAGNHTVIWRGGLASGTSVVINYTGQVIVPIDTEDSFFFINQAVVNDGVNAPFTLIAWSAVNPHQSYMPIIKQ